MQYFPLQVNNFIITQAILDMLILIIFLYFMTKVLDNFHTVHSWLWHHGWTIEIILHLSHIKKKIITNVCVSVAQLCSKAKINIFWKFLLQFDGTFRAAPLEKISKIHIFILACFEANRTASLLNINCIL